MSAVRGQPCAAEHGWFAPSYGRQTQHTPTSLSRDSKVHEPVLEVTVHDWPSRACARLTTLSHPHSVPTPQTANVWTSGGLGRVWGLSTGGGTGSGIRSSAIACPLHHTARSRAHPSLMNLLMYMWRLHSPKALLENRPTPSFSEILRGIKSPAAPARLGLIVPGDGQ
jgi:hypothetical protein